MSVSELVAPVSARDPKTVAAALRDLAAAFGNRLVTSQAVREQHGHTTTWIPNQPPDAVVFPQASADVQQVVRICAKHKMPIIPFGTGTSLEGHVNAPLGGVSIDFRDMNRILAVHAEDLDCVIEPGVTRKQVNEYLRDQGLFFPIDPGADASLGGMAATRASGTNAVRYGTMKDNVLSHESRARQRRDDHHCAASEEILGRLRSHAADDRLGRHARRHHRTHAEALRHSGGDLGRRLPVPVGGRGLQCDHPHDPIRHSGRAHRIARRVAGAGDQRLFEIDLARDADAAGRISRLGDKRRRTGGTLRRDREGSRRRTVRMGDQGRGPHAAVAGAA